MIIPVSLLYVLHFKLVVCFISYFAVGTQNGSFLWVKMLTKWVTYAAGGNSAIVTFRAAQQLSVLHSRL